MGCLRVRSIESSPQRRSLLSDETVRVSYVWDLWEKRKIVTRLPVNKYTNKRIIDSGSETTL